LNDGHAYEATGSSNIINVEGYMYAAQRMEDRLGGHCGHHWTVDL